jgi:hypothetical protein
MDSDIRESMILERFAEDLSGGLGIRFTAKRFSLELVECCGLFLEGLVNALLQLFKVSLFARLAFDN